MTLPSAATPSDSSLPGRHIARAAVVVLLAGAVLAAQVPTRFSLGDGRERVRQIQGPPDVVERLASQGVEHWSWDDGGATVTFDGVTGRVVGWNDRRHLLRVALRTGHTTRDSAIALGAGLAEVARLIGTPWAVTRDLARGHMYLAYGQSLVRVDLATQRVSGWIRRDPGLRVSMTDDSLAHAALATRPPAHNTDWPRGRVPGGRVATSLGLAAVHIADASGDGRLAPREFADITFRVHNEGPASTPALPAHVAHSAGLVMIAGAPDTLWLAPLSPGDTADVIVTAYATGAVPSPELALIIWTGNAPTRLSVRIPTSAGAASRLTAIDRRRGARDDSVSAEQDLLTTIPAARARNPDGLAIVIGIEHYQRIADARYATRDAELMRAYTAQALGVPDDASHVAYRGGNDATGTELRRLFGERGWLARRATDNSDILVYFAGHGAADGAQHTPFLLPWDADPNYVGDTGLDLLALFERLSRLPARSITVILDACFSGLGRSGRPLVAGTRAAVVSIEHPALVRHNMAVFLASRDAQVAGDLPEARHGAFTWYIARGLRGDADANHDRVITVAELGRYAETAVARAAAAVDREQQPLVIARDSLRAVVTLAPVR